MFSFSLLDVDVDDDADADDDNEEVVVERKYDDDEDCFFRICMDLDKNFDDVDNDKGDVEYNNVDPPSTVFESSFVLELFDRKSIVWFLLLNVPRIITLLLVVVVVVVVGILGLVVVLLDVALLIPLYLVRNNEVLRDLVFADAIEKAQQYFVHFVNLLQYFFMLIFSSFFSNNDGNCNDDDDDDDDDR